MLYHATRPQPECHKSRKARTHQHQMVYCCSVADIKLCTDFRRCLLTVSADIAWTISAIQHALDYAIYGQGGAFDVTHEVTTKRIKVLMPQCSMNHLRQSQCIAHQLQPSCGLASVGSYLICNNHSEQSGHVPKLLWLARLNSVR